MNKETSYLVVCLDQVDCIDNMQEVFLIISTDPEMKGNYKPSIKDMVIYSDSEMISFIKSNDLGDELKKEAVTKFKGVTKSKRYSQLADFESKEKYNRIYQRTLQVYGKNDSENFIVELIEKAGAIDVFTQLSK